MPVMAAQMTPDTTPEPWIPDDTFRHRLGTIRVALGGLNIKEAAQLCGISPENWRRWEDGKSPRNLESVCDQISRATGLDYQWLIAGGPLRTGSFASRLTCLDDVIGQGTLLDTDLEPLDFYSRPILASV
jgi:hypothetical protein